MHAVYKKVLRIDKIIKYQIWKYAKKTLHRQIMNW